MIFDVQVQDSAALNASAPFYNPVTGQTSATVPVNSSETYHVEAGYDPSGQLVVNIQPTGDLAATVSMIRLAGGQITVFDQDGNIVPLVPPAANAPLPVALQYLGANPGSSVLDGIVIPGSNISAYAAARGGTLYSPPRDCAAPCTGGTGGGTVELTAPMTVGQGGTIHWWYSASNGYDVAYQAEIDPNTANGTASRVLAFSNVTWYDNTTNDQARANQANTATLPPAASSATFSASSSPSSSPQQLYSDGGAQNLVLQHGLFSSSATWDRMYPWLLDDFRLGTVLIPSLPSTDPLASQTTDLINAVNGAGGGGYILIGHSQGGLISRGVAQHYWAGGQSGVVRSVITLDAPNLGAPLAVTGPGYAGQLVTNLIYNNFQSAGCQTIYDSPLCLADYLAALGTGWITQYGLENAAPAFTDLAPGSSYLNGLNAGQEPFTKVGITGHANSRWVEYRLGGDAIPGCEPESWCGGRAAADYAEIVHDTLLGLSVLSFIEGDFPQGEYYAGLALQMDDIDAVWNALVDSPGDGIVPTSSQAYPNSSATQYIINNADSHLGATRSPLVRTELDAALSNDFHVATQASCSFSAAPDSASVAVNGGSGDLTLNTQPGCGFSAISDKPWLSPSEDTGLASGNSVSLSFTARANPTTTPRNGTITFGNAASNATTLTVHEAGICDYSVAPLTVYEPSSGGGGYIEVNPTNNGCVWSAVPQESWLSVTNGFGTGQYGGFNFTVAPNSGGANLAGTIAVTGATVSFVVGGTNGASSTASITVRQTGPVSKQGGVPGHSYTIYNFGSIAVTVGGVKETVYYGQGGADDAGAVASALAQALGQPGALTTAALTGTSVMLTSKLRGSGTDYSITHAYTWDTGDFNSPAFTVTQSGGSITGGAN